MPVESVVVSRVYYRISPQVNGSLFVMVYGTMLTKSKTKITKLKIYWSINNIYWSLVSLNNKLSTKCHISLFIYKVENVYNINAITKRCINALNNVKIG